jgi:hypothetical protein
MRLAIGRGIRAIAAICSRLGGKCQAEGKHRRRREQHVAPMQAHRKSRSALRACGGRQGGKSFCAELRARGDGDPGAAEAGKLRPTPAAVTPNKTKMRSFFMKDSPAN